MAFTGLLIKLRKDYCRPLQKCKFAYLNNVERGKYTIGVSNSWGQHILTKEIELSDGAATENIALPKGLSSGIYALTLKGNGITISRKIIKISSK